MVCEIMMFLPISGNVAYPSYFKIKLWSILHVKNNFVHGEKMYDLTKGLRYNTPLDLKVHYRYDFVGIDYGNNFINKHIFVFRTIKEGKGKGNILIDLIHSSNIDAIRAHMHGDCHFHIFEDSFSIGNEPIKITENVFLGKIENTSNNEYYVSLKEQQYRLINGVGPKHKHFPVVKYLLFTEYHAPLANLNALELAPIFKLQKEHIWHNERSWNCRNISWLDIDDSSAMREQVKEIIEKGRGDWREEERKKWHQLSERKRLQEYFPIGL
nr:hypothetical protein [Bacillus cereus group sp. BfR-BA-01315]